MLDEMRDGVGTVPTKLIVSIVVLIFIVIAFAMTVGVNDGGHRTVVQWPNGHLFVKFEPGWYVAAFGTTETYNDLLTMDFDKLDAEGDKATIDQKGIAVRYQDGGTGTIYGKARFNLPNDEETMIKLHKAFRSNNGLAFKLIKPVVEEAENLTAGLMPSEDAYATKRATFTQWSHDQIKYGKLKTVLTTVEIKDESTGKVIEKKIPEPKLDTDGNFIYFPSDLAEYGVTCTGYQLTDWDFEPKTLEQIQTKRKATMAIITAKANAEKAKQDAITAEEEGKAAVMVAKYEKEVEKERAVVDAQKAKEVAVIQAQQKVDVAAQQKLEKEQLKLAAMEYKEEQILIGEGDAERKRLVMKADGALEQKLRTYERVNSMYAEAISNYAGNWVPLYTFGGGSDQGTTDGAQTLINLLTAKTAQDLSLNMSVPTNVQ